MIIYNRKRPDSKVEHNFFLESCLNMAKCGFLSSKYYDFCKIFTRKKPLYISHWVVLVATVPKFAPKTFGYPLHQENLYTHKSLFSPKKNKTFVKAIVGFIPMGKTCGPPKSTQRSFIFYL
jgi:hypothetical protein